MAEAHSTTTISSYYYWLAALGVVLLVLVASSGGLFFAVERVPNSAVSASLKVRGSLDRDANNNGNVDGMTKPPVTAKTR